MIESIQCFLSVQRWWAMYNCIPWADRLSLNLASYLPGDGEAKRVRRYVVRLANLSAVMCLQKVSTGVARRFPNYDSMVTAGLMTKAEEKRMEKIDETVKRAYQTTWYPIKWAQTRLRKCYKRGMIDSPYMFTELQGNLSDYARLNGTLFDYTWINVPLVYTQLVTIAVYIYFYFVSLFSSQLLKPAANVNVNSLWGNPSHGLNESHHSDSTTDDDPDAQITVDFPFPFFTVLQFIFYFGWLRIAEVLINPFGEDDDDFDINFILDRNIQIRYLL